MKPITPLPVPAAYLACFTRRWSNGPNAAYMAHVTDHITAHSGRMATLALLFWPDASRDLLVKCIVHDLGEFATGDVSSPEKDRMSDAEREALNERERQARLRLAAVFEGPVLTLRDHARFRFLDRYDAYLIAQVNMPHQMDTTGWAGDRVRLETLAGAAGAVHVLEGRW